MRRRCFSHPCRSSPPPPPSSHPRFLSLVLFSHRASRFLFSIFTPGSSGCHGARAKIGTTRTGMIPTTSATTQRKWGRLRLVLTYVLYSLSVCYFRLNVCFPASRVYLHRRLSAPYSLMNLFFRAAPLHSSKPCPGAGRGISKLRIYQFT